MTIIDATIKENAAILAGELTRNKTITIGSLNGTDNVWDILTQPTPEMVIAIVGTPPGGHWETTTIRPAQTIERDQGEGGYDDLVTMGPVVNINWVQDPPIPEQPYTPAIPAAEIAAMTASNTDEAILPPAAGYTVVGVPIVKKTIAFKTTESLSHKVTKVSYMRQRLIEFVVDGLRPFARHYILFDDVRVDTYATSIDHPYTFNNKLVADASGKLVGLIRIPPNTFKCGEHIITITDALLPGDPETSIAESIFIAKGLLDTSTRVYKTTKTVTMRASIDYRYISNPPPPPTYYGGNC